MSDDYLWDKRGEPDPDVQRLEQILGTLRYQEKPLEFPEQIAPARSINPVFLLAIAATLLIALVAAGLWLMVRKNQMPRNQLAIAPAAHSTPKPEKEAIAPNKPKTAEPVAANNPETQRRPHFAKAKIPAKPALSPMEQKEAFAAKQQLLLALRLASEKLNEVQRRTVAPTTPMKNQHKVG